MQQQLINWYHSNLQHAGVTHTINTIGQTFAWPGLWSMVEKHIETWTRSHTVRYLLPQPWERRINRQEKVHLDCSGPWKIHFENDKMSKISEIKIHIHSMVNTCTNWCEFARINTASSIATTKAFYTEWLCCYPKPNECGHNNGNKFTVIKFQELLDYGIKSKPTRVKILKPTQSLNICMEHLEKNFKPQSLRMIGALMSTPWCMQ